MLGLNRVLEFQRGTVWQGYVFQQPEMEQLYQEHRCKSILPFAMWWGINHIVIYTALLLLSGFKYGWFKAPSLSMVPYTAPLPLVLALLPVIRFTGRFPKAAEQLLCSTCIILVGFLCWQVPISADDELNSSYTSTLPDVWATVEAVPSAKEQLTDYIRREAGRKCAWVALAQASALLGFLHFIGLSRYTLAAYLSFPFGMVGATYLSSLLCKDMAVTFVGIGLMVMYSIIMGLYMLRSHRHQFQLDYNLQRSLAKEAQTMQELMRQEKALKETSQEADTILNHILKNMMADAHSCIHFFMDSLEGPVPPDLAQASSCLERGMTWCQKRHAILQITAGNYVPPLSHTNLKEMGAAIVRGRNVATSFPDQQVLLDPLLCEIVWDNALNNAFRHGHPVNPDVHFSMSLTPLSSSDVSGGRFRLLVIITNRADPSRSPLTQEQVTRMASKERAPGPWLPSAPLSEHLGLPHMFMAAQAHNMLLSLDQFGNRVVLEAQLEVSVTPAMADSMSHYDVPSLGALQAGLTILCIDDSPVARRLLKQMLTGGTLQSSVQVFGKDADDVHTFMEQALTADIIILDNHLDFGNVHLLGVDLLARLLQKGYRGFACIRSANASSEDETVYRRKGAHLTLGKDLTPAELIAKLSAAYAQWQHTGCMMHSIDSTPHSDTVALPSLAQEQQLCYDHGYPDLMPGAMVSQSS